VGFERASLRLCPEANMTIASNIEINLRFISHESLMRLLPTRRDVIFPLERRCF